MITSENHEECLFKNLAFINNSIKAHSEILTKEMDVQRALIERLWTLAQRYSIVNKAGNTKLKLPFETIHPPENEIKAEFLAKCCTLESSNLKLNASLSNVKNTFGNLEQFLTEIGADSFVLLDHAKSLHLPFSSCIEILQDLIKYFIKLQSQNNCIALLLRPDSVPSVERYKKLLKPNRDFNEHMSKSLAMIHFLNKSK